MGFGLWVSKPHWDWKSKLSQASGTCRAAAWAGQVRLVKTKLCHTLWAACMLSSLECACICTHVCACASVCTWWQRTTLGINLKIPPTSFDSFIDLGLTNEATLAGQQDPGALCFPPALGLPSTPSCLSFFIIIFNFMHTYVLFVYVHTCGCGWPENSKEGVGSPRTRVADGCRLPCGCWERNPSLLQEYRVLLTAEASLPWHLCLCKF